jgi:outer membrane protein assembly factor BamA
MKFFVFCIAIVCLLFLICDSSIYAQDKLVIKKIVFIGNERTKSEIIARELTFSVGSAIDTTAIAYNENRIYGLGLFNKVKIWFESDSNDSAIVYVWVNERWYIWPFPIFGWVDRDLKKLFYGAGLIHTNFRGRNEKLLFSFALGYDPWVEIEYRNPWVLGSKNLFYSVEAFYQKIKSKSKILEDSIGSFYEKHFALNFALGKRYGLYKRAWILIGSRVVSTTGSKFQLKTLSPSGRDEILTLEAGFKYDTRDIPSYPNQGFLISIAYRFNQLLSLAGNYAQGGIEVQTFNKIGYGLVAGRFFVLNSFGKKIPLYSRFYFGYQERIRGYFNDVFEGENIFGGKLEYRIPIIKQKFLKWKKSPIDEFSILRFGLDFAVFGDIGRTWFNGENILKLRYLKGYGLGLNFLLPYDLILSLEFAQNDKGRKQFILDFWGNF